MAKSGMVCVKYILGAFNFALVVLAILVIAFEVKDVGIPENLQQILDIPNKADWALIFTGMVLFAIAFLGCWGSFRENHCMLISYGIILFIILLIEFVIIGLIFAFKSQIGTMTQDTMSKRVKQYDFTYSNTTNNQIIDSMQTHFNCCGAFNFTDYFVDTNQLRQLPSSCCAPLVPNSVIGNFSVPKVRCTEALAYRIGCIEVLKEKLLKVYGPVSGFGLTLIIIQLLGLLFACFFAYSIKKSYQTV